MKASAHLGFNGFWFGLARQTSLSVRGHEGALGFWTLDFRAEVTTTVVIKKQ